MYVCLSDGMYVWVWKFVLLDVCVCLDVCMLARLDVYVGISVCLTACMCQYRHITPALRQLRWLQVKLRVTNKLCLLMHAVHVGRC